jgi:hypothetical protein
VRGRSEAQLRQGAQDAAILFEHPATLARLSTLLMAQVACPEGDPV